MLYGLDQLFFPAKKPNFVVPSWKQWEHQIYQDVSIIHQTYLYEIFFKLGMPKIIINIQKSEKAVEFPHMINNANLMFITNILASLVISSNSKIGMQTTPNDQVFARRIHDYIILQ